jgi:hypothetical protein
LASLINGLLTSLENVLSQLPIVGSLFSQVGAVTGTVTGARPALASAPQRAGASYAVMPSLSGHSRRLSDRVPATMTRANVVSIRQALSKAIDSLRSAIASLSQARRAAGMSRARVTLHSLVR